MGKIAIVMLGLLLLFLVVLTGCGFTGATVGSDASDSGRSCFFLSGRARDNCYLEQGKCSRMNDVLLRDSCVVDLARRSGNLQVCNLITTEKTRAYCQQQLAVLTNDHTLCTPINDSYWEDNCHYHLAVNNSRDVYCSLIHHDEQRTDCFRTIAYATNNTLLCEFLGEEQETCIFRIATAIWDETLCEQLRTPLNVDACRLKIAKYTRNKQLCDKIKFSDVRAVCKEYFPEESPEGN